MMNYKSGKEACLKVCQECYDSALISAWEAWDAENESDNDNPKVYPVDQFILEGKKSQVQAFGLLVSIIDFTFSRINTGEDVLFLDLSSNPEPFEGPKGNKQANTYRKMRDVTDKCWERRKKAPKTKELRSLKKRLNSYGSVKEVVSDPFFSGLLIEKL